MQMGCLFRTAHFASARTRAIHTGKCSANSGSFDSADAPLKVTEVIVIPSEAAGAVEESGRSDGRKPVRIAIVNVPIGRDVSTSGPRPLRST